MKLALLHLLCRYILPTVFGFFAAWSIWYLWFYNGTSDLLTILAIFDVGFSLVAVVFVIGVNFFNL